MKALATPEGAIKLNVLLVEDDPLIHTNTAELPATLGHDVLAASTAEGAMSALSAQLVTDVGLPDACGTDLARKARALQPDLLVVFATGNEDVAGADFNAATTLLRKPYSSVGVLAKVMNTSRADC